MGPYPLSPANTPTQFLILLVTFTATFDKWVPLTSTGLYAGIVGDYHITYKYYREDYWAFHVTLYHEGNLGWEAYSMHSLAAAIESVDTQRDRWLAQQQSS